MSHRLVTDAELLGETSGFKSTADVGCDHGYVSMYLVLSGISDRAIAMDVRQGPLSAARGNIEEFGLTDRIETRLSDGLERLQPGEADSLVIAGMGGKLMISILDRKDLRSLGIIMGVLQPQSDLSDFRKYLRSKGYTAVSERVVLEDGKYYFPMLVDFSPAEGAYQGKVKELSGILAEYCGEGESSFDIAERLSDRYGVCNILNRDEVLLEYLIHGAEVDRSILKSLDERLHEGRYREVTNELSDIELLLKLFE
jgi:tRNA (adenine22-N1)-methyltransferase